MSERARGPCAGDRVRGAECAWGSREEEGVSGVVRASMGGRGSEAPRDPEKPLEGLSWGETGSDSALRVLPAAVFQSRVGPGQPAGQAEGRGEGGQDPHAVL